MPNGDKIQALYNAASKEYDLGSYNDFVQKLQDPNKRQALYNAIGKEYDLGDYNTFNQKLGYDSQEVKQANVNQQPYTDNTNNTPTVNFDNQIQQLRQQQKAANTPDNQPMIGGDIMSGAMGTVNDNNNGIESPQKNAQADFETGVNSIASLWNAKPEDVKQVLNDVPDENNGDNLQQLVDTKVNNPYKYNRIAPMRNIQYQIAQKAGVHQANTFNELNSDYTSLDDLQQKVSAQQNIINSTFDGNDKIKNNQQLEASVSPLININKPDILKEYFNPQTNPLKDLINENQFAGLKTLQIFEPDVYNQYVDALQKSRDVKFGTTDYQVGVEKIKKELEDRGIQNLVNESNEKIADINQQATNASPEQKQALQQQFNDINGTLSDIPYRQAKYPLLDAVKTDEQIKEMLGYNPAFGKSGVGVLPYNIAKNAIGNVTESLNNIFTNLLGSDADKTNLFVQKKGEGVLNYEYEPEGFRSQGSQNVYQFPKNVISQANDIQNNNKLSDEEKYTQQAQLLKDNADKVKLIANPDAGKNADFLSKATLYHNIATIGDIVGFAAQSYLMGGTGNGLSKTQRMINAATPMFLSTQNDFYKQAVDNNISNPLAYANTHAAILAAAGLINPDLNIVKRSLGIGTTAGKLLAGMDEGTWNKVIEDNPKLLNKIANSAKSVIGEAGKMAAVYGVGTQLLNDTADKLFFNQPISGNDIINHAAKAAKDVTLNSLALFGLNAINNFKSVTPFDKQRIYELGDNPNLSINDINKDVNLSQDQKQQRIETVNNIAALKSQVPETISNPQDRHNYLYNLFVKNKANETAKILPEKQKEDLQKTAIEADESNNIILEQPTDKQLEKRKTNLENDLAVKEGDENKKPLNDKQKIQANGELAAVTEEIKNRQVSIISPDENKKTGSIITIKNGEETKVAPEQTISGSGENNEPIPAEESGTPTTENNQVEQSPQENGITVIQPSINTTDISSPINTENNGKETEANAQAENRQVVNDKGGNVHPTNEQPPLNENNLGSKARNLAQQLRSGDKNVLPDWLRADLPKGTQKGGISLNDAFAKALETFADIHDATKDVVKAVEAGFKHLKDWFDDNNVPYNENDLKDKFRNEIGAKARMSGISHNSLKDVAERLGLPKPERGQVLSPEEYNKRGKLLYKNGADYQKMADEFEDDGKVNADMIGVANARLDDLADQADKAKQQFGGNSKEYKAAQKAYQDWRDNIAKPMGTKFGEIGRAMQGQTDLDRGSFTSVKSAVEDVTDKPTNAAQQKKIEDLTNENTKLKQQAAETEKKAIEETDKELNKPKTATDKKFASKAKSFADSFRKLKTKPFTFKDENGNDIPIQIQGATWNDLVELGAKAIEKTGEIADGVATIIEKIKDSDFYAKLSDNDKQKFKDQLQQHYENNGIVDDKDTKATKANITKLQNELDRLKKEQTLKQKNDKRDLTDEEVELNKNIKEEQNKIILKNLQKQFADKSSKDKKFTTEETKDLWNYTKDEYLDKGVGLFDAMKKVADDTGLTFEQVNGAFKTPKTKSITDAAWLKQYQLRKSKASIDNYIENQNRNPVSKVWHSITRVPKAITTAIHGHVFPGTHYSMGFLTPQDWGMYFKSYAVSAKNAYGSDSFHEQEIQRITGNKNYAIARRAGLANDVERTDTDDFENAPKIFGKIGKTGTKGFLGLKDLRQNMFDRYFDALSKDEQNDNTAEAIAYLVNSATLASNIKIPAFAKEGLFSAGMESARWGKVFKNPVKAAAAATRITAALIKGEEIKPEDKVFVKIWGSRVGQQLATMAGVIALNAYIQSKVNPKNPVNWNDPTQSDYLNLKIGDQTVDLSGGVLGIKNFLLPVTQYAINDKNYKKEMGDIGGKVLQYGRNKLSPFYGDVSDIGFGTDWAGNPLPWSKQKPGAGKHTLNWPEYLSEKAPIFASDALSNMFTTAEEQGVPKTKTEKIVNQIINIGLTGGFGLHNHPSYQPQTPYTEQDKKDPTFKYFLDKGLQLPNTSLNSEEITNEKTGTKKKISDYPQDIQQKYQDEHKAQLKTELQKIKTKNYVYVSTYKDAQDKDVTEVELHPKNSKSKKVTLDKLSNDELAQVLHLAQSQATTKAKKKIFK